MASIETDRGIGVILSNFESDYITHVMEDSLNIENRFRPFANPMPNFVDILQRNFLATLAEAPDYRDKINDVVASTYQEIILMICKYYNLKFCMPFEMIDDPAELYGVTRSLYEVFVANFTNYMVDFFTNYIIKNADQIANYLANGDYIKPKETGLYDRKRYVDPKFILIHANINAVIQNMASYDISLYDMLNYFFDPATASRISSMLTDIGDIYKTYYASCIIDPRYSAGIITNVKLKLQSLTYENVEIEMK